MRWTIRTSPPATRSTGRAGGGGARRWSSVRATSSRWPLWSRGARPKASPSSRRAATPGSSVVACRSPVRSWCRLRGLVGVDDIDADGGQLTARAGTTVAEVQTAAGTVGWSYGVDLAARDSATIGGTVATNAGGLRVLRYGDTRAQLVGVGGRARRRLGDRAPRRAREGQHRLPPPVAALRERRHPRASSPPPGCDSSRATSSASSHSSVCRR